MIKVGIAVGHFGPGTGTSFQMADEWLLASADAHAIALKLHEDGKLIPVLEVINQEEHPWDLVQKVSKASLPSFLGLWGNIDVRYEWALREGVEALVELHYNSAMFGKPKGHEAWVRRSPGPKTTELGNLVIGYMNEHCGNPNRGLRAKSFRTLRRLHAANVPAVVLEPAFITEACVLLPEWQAAYRGAVVLALYTFFNV